MISESLSHYPIIKKLGAGGLGEVYLAEDTKLDLRIWTRAMNGSVPKQLTRFTSEYIFEYARSGDGKQFAVARGTSTVDVT